MDLKTQPKIENVFKKHKITPIYKEKKDNYTYLQDDLERNEKIYHCNIVGEQRLFFVIRTNEIYILDACNRHK